MVVQGATPGSAQELFLIVLRELDMVAGTKLESARRHLPHSVSARGQAFHRAHLLLCGHEPRRGRPSPDAPLQHPLPAGSEDMREERKAGGEKALFKAAVLIGRGEGPVCTEVGRGTWTLLGD